MISVRFISKLTRWSITLMSCVSVYSNSIIFNFHSIICTSITINIISIISDLITCNLWVSTMSDSNGRIWCIVLIKPRSTECSSIFGCCSSTWSYPARFNWSSGRWASIIIVYVSIITLFWSSSFTITTMCYSSSWICWIILIKSWSAESSYIFGCWRSSRTNPTCFNSRTIRESSISIVCVSIISLLCTCSFVVSTMSNSSCRIEWIVLVESRGTKCSDIVRCGWSSRSDPARLYWCSIRGAPISTICVTIISFFWSIFESITLLFYSECKRGTTRSISSGTIYN